MKDALSSSIQAKSFYCPSTQNNLQLVTYFAVAEALSSTSERSALESFGIPLSSKLTFNETWPLSTLARD